ncbi:mucin-12-like [Prionailurus bengalensis]|uniref:mucin-12-like n=1 Tax=Prionailurus bengalensis TaxID=37029 RepID=UPI001CA85A73|nr:mucin-12-like [Prionailurus bengalensis]
MDLGPGKGGHKTPRLSSFPSAFGTPSTSLPPAAQGVSVGRQEYNLWQGEDLPGGFQNTGIWEDENLKEDRFALENIYSHFQPSLENVDPTTELHIQRPRVLTTAQ